MEKKRYAFYTINGKTICMIKRFGPNGEVYSTVIEFGRTIYVDQPPLEIIKKSMLKFGQEFNGAMKAARMLLEIKQTPPLQISGYHKLYWIATEKYTNDGCVFIAMHQIANVERCAGRRKTIVQFKNGHELEVGISLLHLKRKIESAKELQSQVEGCLNEEKHPIKYSGVSIVREEARSIYCIIEKPKFQDIEK